MIYTPRGVGLVRKSNVGDTNGEQLSNGFSKCSCHVEQAVREQNCSCRQTRVRNVIIDRRAPVALPRLLARAPGLI